MRKPIICTCENKVLRCRSASRYNREADQRLCFRYTDSTLHLPLKSEISSFKPASVTVQPDLCRTCSETRCLVFSRDGSYVVHCDTCKTALVMPNETGEHSILYIPTEGSSKVLLCSEPHREKNGFLPMRKQRRRSASR